MNETEFNALAEGTLASVVRALESSGVDCDCEFKGDGVLELEFENHSKIIVNRHAPAKEGGGAGPDRANITAGSGARGGGTRASGEALFATLSRCVSEQSGSPVVLS